MNQHNDFSEFEEKVLKAVQTPEADSGFVHQLRRRVVGHKVKRTSVRVNRKFQFKPAWALIGALLALVVLLAGTPKVVRALQQLLGYVPGVGLVDSSTRVRVLAEPVSQTRDGVTLTIENVFVFEDRVELLYAVDGIDPMDDGTFARDAVENPSAFCGGVEVGAMANLAGDAVLRLPDGSILERDQTGAYPQNAFAMQPVFSASVPEDVMTMTLLLDCIPWARLGAVPENWEVPFKLVEVPEGEAVGLPVIEVQESAQPVSEMDESPDSEFVSDSVSEDIPAQDTLPSELELAVLPDPQIEMTLEKAVLADANVVFYFSMQMKNPDPSLVSIMPEHVHLVDSEGQVFQLILSGPWQPFLHKTGTLFEYVSLGKPADGPLTIVVEDAVLYFAPLYVNPPQAEVEALSFSFNVEEDPQTGQRWDLDAPFEIAGYPFRVASAEAVTWEDVAEPSYIDGSQGYDFGYQFEIVGDPRLKMSVQLDLLSESCGLWVETPSFPESSHPYYTILCRESFPEGEVLGYIRELAVQVEESWELTWAP
jgi:hypothetical protein